MESVVKYRMIFILLCLPDNRAMQTSLNLSPPKEIPGIIIMDFFLQRSLTGFKNLDEVEFLEMKVDTRENSLGNFGKCKEVVLIINFCQICSQ